MALGEDWSNGLARERSLRGAAHASLRDSQTLDRNTDAETAAVELEIAQLQASQADAGTAATVDASAAAAATDYMYAGGTGGAGADSAAAEEAVGAAAAAAAPVPGPSTSINDFNNWHYIQHNQRRQEHLCSLGLDLSHKRVLEVGAGIGDHTTFFIDRGCDVVVTEGRPENFRVLQQRYPHLETHLLDMEAPGVEFGARAFEIVYCYGLLYHLRDPTAALAYMARHCSDLLLLELCVTPGEPAVPEINTVGEPQEATTQATSGQGCRPHRSWVFNQLRTHFEHVYMPETQPWHSEFPLDWQQQQRSPPAAAAAAAPPLTRAVFVASRRPLENSLLHEVVPPQQRRH